jgi:hypothetical protein
MFDVSWWITWLAGRIGIPGGLAASDEDEFTAWLMGRIHIPGG